MYTNQRVLFWKIMSHRLDIFSDEDTSLVTFFRTMFLHQTTQILTNNYLQHVSLQHERIRNHKKAVNSFRRFGRIFFGVLAEAIKLFL